MLQGLAMITKMLDEVLSARNKLNKVVLKLAKDKKAEPQPNTQENLLQNHLWYHITPLIQPPTLAAQ